MPKKIVFVNPPLSLEERYKDLAGAGNDLPPLGLATLAAVTREAGYETKILDVQAMRMTYDEAVDWIMKERPDYVGITAVTLSIFKSAELAKRLRKRSKKLKILLGGPHVTAAPIETMKRFPDFDVAAYGESEDTILELLPALDAGADLSTIKGLIIRKGKDVVLAEKRPYIMDLDRLPLPAWDLLPDLIQYYQPPADALHRSPCTLLITSRGCPGLCTFCDKSVFGGTIRGFSADYILRMISYLQEHYGIKDVFIEDDNFIVFKRRLIEFCNRVIDEKVDITWSCAGRVDNINLDLLKLMKKAGCWQINYGCESGSQKVLDILKKNIKVGDIEKAIRLTRKAGIKVKGLFMMGNFGETKESIDETIRFIKRVPMSDFHMTCFTPLPGAPAWEMAAQYGWFDPDWRKADFFSATNFVPTGFTREEIERHYRRAWMASYLKPHVVWDYCKKLGDPRMRRKILKGGWSFAKFLLKRPKSK